MGNPEPPTHKGGDSIMGKRARQVLAILAMLTVWLAVGVLIGSIMR